MSATSTTNSTLLQISTLTNVVVLICMLALTQTSLFEPSSSPSNEDQLHQKMGRTVSKASTPYTSTACNSSSTPIAPEAAASRTDKSLTDKSLSSTAFPLYNAKPGNFSLLSDRGVVAGTCVDAGWDYVFSYSQDTRSPEWDASAVASHRTKGKYAALCGYGYDTFFDGIGTTSTENERVMLDIGANMGLSLFPYYTKRWKIIAFEPIPDNLNTIRRNIYLNGIQDNDIALVQGAVTNTSGTVQIYAPKGRADNSAMSKAASTRNVGGKADALTVPAIQIDAYLDSAVDPNLKKRIAFIKIDTQGHEMSVLQGMKRFLSNPPSTETLGGLSFIVQAEFDPKLQRASGNNPNDMLTFMRDLGYEVRCQFDDVQPIPPLNVPTCKDVIFSFGKPVKPTAA